MSYPEPNTIITAEPVRDVPPAEHAMNELRGDLARAADLLDLLAKRLHPALRPVPDTEPAEKLAAVKQVASPHVNALWDLGEQISAIHSRVGSLLNRLEF